MKKMIVFTFLWCAATIAYAQKAEKTLEGDGYQLSYQSSDPYMPVIQTYVSEGLAFVSEFLDGEFKETVTVRLFASREKLDAAWSQEWGMPGFKTECWMVGSGIASKLDVLSPNVWQEQACEHDPKDSIEIKQLVFHELTHVLHSDYNRSRMFDDIRNIDWLVEGLATYVSGQLDEERFGRVKTYVEETGGPGELALFWKGEHKYGLSGSMMAYIDQAYGRKVLIQLMEYNYLEDVLSIMKTTEPLLIEQWREFVLTR